MTRYLLLTEFFPPQTGGIQNTLSQHASWLGPDVAVVAPPTAGHEAFDRQQPYPVTRRSLFSGQFRPSWLWLVPWLWRRRGQLKLVLFGHYSPAVTAAWLLKPFGLRYGLFVHGDDLLRELRRPGRRWLTRAIVRGAEWVDVNSRFMRQQVYQLGLPQVRIFSSHPSIPDDLLSTPRSPHHATPPRLITVCRLVRRKNVQAILRAMPVLRRRWPDIHYHVVGDGPERPALERLSRELGLESVVTFAGYVPEAVKWDLLRQATVGILVPRGEHKFEVEGFGVFFLEAYLAGLAVVGRRSGGVAEAVIDGQTGLLISDDRPESVATAVADLLVDDGRRMAMAEAGRRLIQTEYRSSLRKRRFLAAVDQPIHPPPLVSVVVPAYQSAKTIGRTLDSLLAQTWRLMEIVVIDDGSTDGLDKALASYAGKIRVARQANQGAPVARNHGASLSNGEFLLFVDADTVLTSTAVETMARALIMHPSASFVYSDFRFGPKDFRLWDFSVEKLRSMNYIHTTSLIRHADFPGFDPSLKRFQDWDLWLTIAEHGKRGAWIPAKLFSVSQRRGGMSTWLPSFVYRLPLIGRGVGSTAVRNYRQAERMIKQKHRLDSD